jgi:hypothetical protein
MGGVFTQAGPEVDIGQSRQPSPALLFFKLTEVETEFPFANSISEFSRGQGPERTRNCSSD